jgi:DNA polymerase-3 subunit delta
MQAKGAAATQALARPDPAIRLYVLGGPDESGSRALAASLGKAMGPDGERIDIPSSKLRDDPATLTDEAAAIGMFGGRRWVLVTLMSGGGDEVMAAATALLEAPAAGNPVVIIGSGITAKSKIAKLAATHPAAMLVISWPPDMRDAGRLANDFAAPLGLELDPKVAQAIAQSCNGDRGLIERETEKLALYCDASPSARKRAGADDWAAIGAGMSDGDIGPLIDAVLDGQCRSLPPLFAAMEADGSGDIRLLRAFARRTVDLAALRVHVEEGANPGRVIESHGRSIFWKEKDAITRQLGLWSADALAWLAGELLRIERAMKGDAGNAMLLLRAGLLDIARRAAAARGNGQRYS